ncbi:DUF2922 domain-containing protein [Clostridium fallax]|uniref:DUF2922 domain-containing protein n=1 Tax=Clostridium fallax TaxID=1533 RepID=A0A1M4Z7S1_9CLOT|nr:DUF2922 domain-containing protein [Clostridium fallax]SHF14123.1 Protein of unknown function [Clostridium fallax]SQB07498.1 Protein of uncharacterised function (DUF2922) [Clostridium fallax]
MTEKYLLMTFKDEAGKKVSISLKGIRDNLNQDEINATMDLLIAKDVFYSSGGSFVSKVKAEIITKQVDSITMA